MEVVIETQPEPSIVDLRGMLSGSAPEPTEAKPETSETKAEPEAAAVEDKTQQAEAEAAETKTEPKEAEKEDEPLPPSVQKRIAREAERAAKIQAEIDRAVSDRKAKEAELSKLKQPDARGSDPDNKPAATAQRPKFGDVEGETYEQYEERRDNWIKAEALREFEAKQAQTEAERRHSSRINEGIERQGKDFPDMVQKVCDVAPQAMQTAIGTMEGWDAVTAHLAKNPEKLADLAGRWEKNPYETIIQLGRMRDSLTATKTEPKTEAPKLPPPPAKVGGNASASGADLQDVLEKGSMSQFKSAALKAGLRTR